MAEDPEQLAKAEEELADILVCSLGMATQLDIDLEQAIEKKQGANEERFDLEKSEEIADDLREWKRE